VARKPDPDAQRQVADPGDGPIGSRVAANMGEEG
jgi:hypothetical protein